MSESQPVGSAPAPSTVMPSTQNGKPGERRYTKRDVRMERAYAKVRAHIAKRARKAGVIGPNDELVADVGLAKYSNAINWWLLLGILPGILFILLTQRGSMVLVTGREVIVTRWGWLQQRQLRSVLRLERPLSESPKRFGLKVSLPAEVANFLGRDVVYADSGLRADQAFQIACTPPTVAATKPTASAPDQPSAPNPAAWCPDPTSRHQLRYWDGQEWTPYVADQGTQSTDPLKSPELAQQ